MALVLCLHFLALLALASGKPIFLPSLTGKASQGDAQAFFDVKIQSLGNTSVKAQITNIGTESVRLVHRGGILDQLPTRKVNLRSPASNPTFMSVQVKYVLSLLSPDAFIQLSPNQAVESTFDVSDLYELSPHQEYTVVAEGILEYATVSYHNKFYPVHFESNSIAISTPTELTKRLETRSTLECTDEYNQIVQNALERAANMATVAAADARNGSDLFEKFFKSTSQDDRDEVADRLEAIAAEATTTGKLTYYCEPTTEDYCGDNIAAMTYPSENKVVNCPGYYETTASNNYCNYLDQAAISLHEFSHADAVYNPGTDDIVYGYDGVLQLNTTQAKNNADSFAYYASAVYLNCAADDSTIIGSPDTDTGDNDPSDTPSEPDDTATTTTDDTPTTSTNASGWDWPLGGDQTGQTPTSTETGPGTGVWGGGGGWSLQEPSSSATPVSTPGFSGAANWDFQDLIDWLMSIYNERAGQSQNQESEAQAEEGCDDS